MNLEFHLLENDENYVMYRKWVNRSKRHYINIYLLSSLSFEMCQELRTGFKILNPQSEIEVLKSNNGKAGTFAIAGHKSCSK